MAAIDYGAVVFKNGAHVNSELFMDMQEAVGWVDVPRLKYEDCDCLYDGRSDCGVCRRALYKYNNPPIPDVWDYAIADCRGKELGGYSEKLDGNYYAYIGDKHLTVCFYKTHFLVVVDGEKIDSVWEDKWRSLRKKYADVDVHVKEIGKRVFLFSMTYKGDHYNVVYGYGIDPNQRVWDRAKVDYLGKKLSRKVDRLYERFGGLMEATDDD